MPNYSQGFGGSGGFQQGWNPFGGISGSAGAANPIGGRSQAQLPSSYGQSQQPINAQAPQSSMASLGTGGFGSTGTGGYTDYAQEIQALGQHGVMGNNAALPGGRLLGQPATPAGVDPLDLLMPTMVGGRQVPGGRTVGGTPTYSPYNQTVAQSRLGSVVDQASNQSLPLWAQNVTGSARTAGHALADYSLGLGGPTEGMGINYSQLAGLINSPAVQMNLPYAWTPPPGYGGWQNQQNWSSLLGDLGDWTSKH
jgi:hypothetical protein